MWDNKKNKIEEHLVEKYGREGGWKVPDGYFGKLGEEIMTQLPPYPEAPRVPKMTKWQRVRPYVYLAAMFAGIWCMMQVFYRVSGGDRISLDNPPVQIAQIMTDSEITDVMYFPSDMISEVALEQEVSDSYTDMEEFAADFAAAGTEDANWLEDNEENKK